MSDPVWYDDVATLWRRPSEFFPTPDQTDRERVNALVRLTAYATLAMFAYNRNPRTLVLGGAVVAVVSLAFSFGAGSDAEHGGSANATDGTSSGTAGSSTGRRRGCVEPTRDNPFANLLPSDLAREPARPGACPYDSVRDDIRANFNAGLIRDALDVNETGNSQRQFYTMPVTTGVPDTSAFANFLFGDVNSCKSDQKLCGPR